MTVLILIIVGLCMGSFVNALVWRLHEGKLSIVKGRSMCPKCRHPLAAKDLVPVLSWLFLKGRCRYCRQPISARYPLVELATAGLFVASYVWWPSPFDTAEKAVFVLWLALLTGLMALLVYDARWSLLPNRIIYPLTAIAAVQAAIAIASAGDPGRALAATLLSVSVGGGIFYVLFQVSQGKWIGGGDVKLGFLLGLIVATPDRAVLFIFLGSLLGSMVSLPLLATGRMKRTSIIPFGPFLIAAAIIAVLFGGDVLDWYRQAFLVR
ncbi:MAG TPA: prepilin peptidase [Candidatus Saccharimonadales bacterium]|nr:prepilin peptidase [Candidatus Saccharimonadales bacterium]